ncbi:Extra-large guanine nucleotide-binding protein 1 [Porphyridium purpureum]|uniref:Extra-large guanine nucleotide-binding protein 1 n=1 Tax=Porphyridium purpureum TaxID=35688 RepID=A0A5J4Z7S2_PORPP|nr:Extra-large guanine nucleotide-binding protein 1 [Porphyridium purpureum]|eukprot:POR4897..scf295_1
MGSCMSAEPSGTTAGGANGYAQTQYAQTYPHAQQAYASPYAAVPAPAPPQASAHAQPAAATAAPVSINRVQLSDAQVRQFAMVGVPLQPGGKYWYDPRSGVWGTEGSGGLGVTGAGNMAFGNVPEDASGRGCSGVFINGRELHPTDVQFLVSKGIPVMPGRYWMNADSTYGYEHMPFTPLGRVNAGKGGGQGGDNFWHSSIAGASGNSDSSGAGYISFGDGSSVSYGM